jgi:hypothetical protein
MKPKLAMTIATVAHFAAEFSTRSWCESCITDGFAKSGYARLNYMYPESEEMSSFNLLFDRSITDGQAMTCSV